MVSARGEDDQVDGGRGGDDIFGGLGGDILNGGSGPDDIDGDAGTPDGAPIVSFGCTISDPSTGTAVASTQGNQLLSGDDGNDDLEAMRTTSSAGLATTRSLPTRRTGWQPTARSCSGRPPSRRLAPRQEWR